MTACVNCTRTLQPAWKFCIFCGTPVAAAATAPRSRPLPKRTPVPGYASVATGQNPVQNPTVQTPIVPPPAPAPLSAAPVEEPASTDWPDELGERPSRSALAGEVPSPTDPVDESVPPPVDDTDVPDVFDEFDDIDEPSAPLTIADLAPEPESEPDLEPEPEPVAGRTRRARSRGPASTAVLEHPLEVETLDLEDDEPADRSGSVNTLAVLALLIGILACPLAAPFGHLALGQVKASGERGLVPAWIAVVLGYLWLGFWIVFVITYFATNG
ncbi:MAG TPA: hypothetical protein VNR36_02680 [Pseudolysinimonas sp.]|nr:hypothetical protein [Pseudolysinimonas sp.]